MGIQILIFSALLCIVNCKNFVNFSIKVTKESRFLRLFYGELVAIFSRSNILLHISLADFDSAQPQELFIRVHFKSKGRLGSTLYGRLQSTREIASLPATSVNYHPRGLNLSSLRMTKLSPDCPITNNPFR